VGTDAALNIFILNWLPGRFWLALKATAVVFVFILGACQYTSTLSLFFLAVRDEPQGHVVFTTLALSLFIQSHPNLHLHMFLIDKFPIDIKPTFHFRFTSILLIIFLETT